MSVCVCSPEFRFLFFGGAVAIPNGFSCLSSQLLIFDLSASDSSAGCVGDLKDFSVSEAGFGAPFVLGLALGFPICFVRTISILLPSLSDDV